MQKVVISPLKSEGGDKHSEGGDQHSEGGDKQKKTSPRAPIGAKN